MIELLAPFAADVDLLKLPFFPVLVVRGAVVVDDDAVQRPLR